MFLGGRDNILAFARSPRCTGRRPAGYYTPNRTPNYQTPIDRAVMSCAKGDFR
jgi:hypothetical protein